MVVDTTQRQVVMEKAAAWMKSRGWKQKLAKGQGNWQSLFQHSLVELDVLLELLPILEKPSHYSLSDQEEKVLVISVIVHDVGKETEEWQSYIGNSRLDHWVPHVLPELTRAVVPELCDLLGFEELDEPVQRTISHCAEFHHNRPGRSDRIILEAMLSGGSDRFLTLAHLVRAIDHFCSASGATEAIGAIRQDPALGYHLLVTSHELTMRGVSTTFLHRAAQSAFEGQGWKPLLYFTEATVYGADPNDDPSVPAVNEIVKFLKSEIDAAVAHDVIPLMVGSPTGNILPKPDLFSSSEARQYLKSAAGKIGPQSFAKKRFEDRRKVVKEYWRLKRWNRLPSKDEVDQESARISIAQPEMMVFKFFKAMTDPNKIGTMDKDGAAMAAGLYEEIFGSGSWAALQSTANLMPAKDMMNTIDCFWSLPGDAVGHPEVNTVAELPGQTRIQVLIGLLAEIADKVYAAIGFVSPRDRLSTAMADSFIDDLVQPIATGDPRRLAQEQLSHYARSKPFAGKDSNKGVYFCPVCNKAFDRDRGVKASADFIDNPQSHTNRAVAHGSFGYVMVCTTCYYERLLTQLLMGGHPAEVVALFPRFNLGPGKGEQFIQKVKEWVEKAQAQMRGDTGNLEVGFSLGFTDQADRKLGERNPSDLEPEELLPLFSYRFTLQTRKQRRREAMKRLKEEFDDDLDTLNVACGQSFDTWENAVTALIEKRVNQHEFLKIRGEVFHLYETMDIICETPNLVFVPLTYQIAANSDESESVRALRRLYASLILSLVFDASVVVHEEGGSFDFRAHGGAAYVPAVSAVRSLVGNDWVTVNEAGRWIRAIGAASRLLRDTGLPARSALHQILTTDPSEQIARRIEEKGGGSLTLEHLRLIEQLPYFRATKEGACS